MIASVVAVCCSVGIVARPASIAAKPHNANVVRCHAKRKTRRANLLCARRPERLSGASSGPMSLCSPSAECTTPVPNNKNAASAKANAFISSSTCLGLARANAAVTAGHPARTVTTASAVRDPAIRHRMFMVVRAYVALVNTLAYGFEP